MVDVDAGSQRLSGISYVENGGGAQSLGGGHG